MTGTPRQQKSPLGQRWILRGVILTVTACLSACAVGPDYHKPSVQIPESFKEGADWQRAQPNPAEPLSGSWWLVYQDARLTQLIGQSLQANQSIIAAEAAYRVALATVQANVASLFPIVSAQVSASRSGSGAGAAAVGTTSAAATTVPGVYNTVGVSASASWEPDLWGQIRREIESAKASAQATDAQLVGERLSIAASVATDYFELRQADFDIQSLQQQQDIDNRILEMTRAELLQGQASNDDLLAAQDTLELVVAELQSTEASREQDEHAIAVLIGVPPANFTLPPEPSFAFVIPAVPLALPSQLLERRYDVVTAERTAASANAKIGAAEAAFFPTLTLSAEGGFQHNTFANLFSLPNRYWTLGPALAETIFDGGARTAAVREARATYDEDVANYRNAVLAAFQTVEDSLSTVNHLRQQTQAYANIFGRNQQLFASERAQRLAGIASEQDLLTQQLTLLQAEQNLRDSQALLAQGTVTLVKNLGGGWQWDDPHIPSTPAPPF
jgi:NodT family efflux transporter outer membrane factor (OMF) lipoprotein